ncbi:MAG: hypothetical protein Sylvanvirus37_6, partial [Sylvanvirus sp.]
MQEALHNHVPVFVIPWFGDQHVTAQLVVKYDIGKAFEMTG